MTPASTGGSTTRPLVSVIVPARNEERCLARCLRSLVAQEGVAVEIIVVDDHSIDRTRKIAESFPTVNVVEAQPLPDGWSGKSNALVTGVAHARGEWLLFTDADTEHLPGSLARALEEARAHSAAMLSYSPAQEVRGFFESAVMPLVFAELAAEYKPREISDPDSPAAAANGQYILITREAYDAAGGHRAIAGALLEDVELARAVKRTGCRMFFRYGADVVRTRMYCGFRELCEGWTKNLALLFRHTGSLAALRLAEFIVIAASVALAVAAAVDHQAALAAVGSAMAIVGFASFLRRIRRAHFGFGPTALAFFGLPLFSYLLLRSRIHFQCGKVTWKGRRYPAAAAHRESPNAMGGTWST
jgi:hypothetical protein